MLLGMDHSSACVAAPTSCMFCHCDNGDTADIEQDYGALKCTELNLWHLLTFSSYVYTYYLTDWAVIRT